MATNNSTNNWVPETVQTSTPTTGSTVTINNQVTHILLSVTPSGGLLSLTVAFPTTPFVGQIIRLSFSTSITSLTLSSSASIVGALTSALLGGFACYQYDGTKWCRVG